MKNNNQIKVMVVDDHKMFLEGICLLIEDHPQIQIIGRFLSAEEFLDLDYKKADVLITDINMPGMGGLALIKKLTKEHAPIKIIALSMHHETKIVSKAFRNGATGFILKNTNQEELIKAIESVYEGETYIGSIVKESYLKQSMLGQANHKFNIPKLSNREKQILALIGDELTMIQIADKLGISQHTVLTYRRKLFSKVGSKNTAGLIKKSMDWGLL